MVTLNRPVSGDLVLATDISNIVAGVLGDAGYGQLWRFHRISDSADYGVILGNADTTNGLAARIQYGDPDGSPTVLADFRKSGIFLNGATVVKQVASLSDPGSTYTAFGFKSDGNAYIFPTGGSETRLAKASEAPSGILTTTGDIIASLSGSTPSRVGIGSTGQALTVVGGVPAWAASPTSVMTGTGDVLTTSAPGVLSRVALGSARFNLGVNSGATGLTYQASLQSLITGAGSLITSSGANTPTELTIGSARQQLAVNSAGTALAYVSSLQSLLSAAGSIIVASGANTPAELTIGSARFNLQVNSAGTGLNYAASLQSLMSGTGDLVYSSGANTPARRAIGTTSQVLTVVGGVPAWADLPAGALPAGDGSAAAPTVNFTNATTAGLYRSGTGFGMAANGTAIATVTTAGLTMGTNLPVIPGTVSGTPAANAVYQESVAKGWAKYAQSGPSLTASYNVSSVTSIAAGRKTIVWDRDFSSAHYAVTVSVVSPYAGSLGGTPLLYVESQAAGSVSIAVAAASDGLGNDGFPSVTCAAFGTQ